MRIAFRCSEPGHLNPMTTLARKLKARGHDVVFISILDTVSKGSLHNKSIMMQKANQ